MFQSVRIRLVHIVLEEQYTPSPNNVFYNTGLLVHIKVTVYIQLSYIKLEQPHNMNSVTKMSGGKICVNHNNITFPGTLSH